MTSMQQDRWRALLEEFVDARIDAPELLERVAELLPAGADPAEEVLTRLAEGEFKLRPPAGRLAFIRRRCGSHGRHLVADSFSTPREP